MAKINRVEPKAETLKRRQKVAAYARVSAETDRLAHSLSAQIDYYRELIQRNPEWEYAGVYADFGVSGTGMDRRSEFKRLLTDCQAGKVDILLTKSISRFARNTVDLLSTVRKLKEIGVEVRFEKEHIHSFSGEGELMLSILGSVAQEESRSISENSKWGIRKKFQSGEIGISNKRLLGYRYDQEQGKYVIIPEEAEAVRWMFGMYLEGLSLRHIAENMNQAGIRTVSGNEFQEASVRRMIFNEVYSGDILRQKSFVKNPVTKCKIINRGQLPQYYIADCHEAIISRETWVKVQREMERRRSMVKRVYPFTGKIKCGICGRFYTRRVTCVKGEKSASWFCRAKKEKGIPCRSRSYTEEKLQEICAGLTGMEVFDGDVFCASVREITVLPDGSFEMKNQP